MPAYSSTRAPPKRENLSTCCRLVRFRMRTNVSKVRRGLVAFRHGRSVLQSAIQRGRHVVLEDLPQSTRSMDSTTESLAHRTHSFSTSHAPAMRAARLFRHAGLPEGWEAYKRSPFLRLTARQGAASWLSEVRHGFSSRTCEHQKVRARPRTLFLPSEARHDYLSTRRSVCSDVGA